MVSNRYFVLFLSIFFCGVVLLARTDQEADAFLDSLMCDNSDYEVLLDLQREGRMASFDPIEILALAKEPLWKNTKAPTGRDVLYLFPQRVAAIEYGGVAGSLFFNMTNRMRLTASSVFNFDSQLQALKDLIAQLPPDIDPEVVHQLVPLLKKITLQERKGGLLLQAGWIHNIFSVQLHTSLQFGERNFWLSPRDQDSINALFPANDGIDESELYKIRVGPGDTRIRVGLNTINMSSFKFDIGLETILPTSRLTTTPRLRSDLSGEISLTVPQVEIVSEVVKTLQRLRDYYITPRIGNDGHFALGTYIEGKIGIFHELAQVRMRLSYDRFFPNDEDRPILLQQTFASGQDFKDKVEEDPNNLLALINRFIGEFIFPPVFSINATPGGVFNAVLAVTMYPSAGWQYTFGYDLYAEQHERINQVYDANIPFNDLRIADAQAQSVVQHKIFTQSLFTSDKGKYAVACGWGTDFTVWAKGIGKDWTVYLKAEVSF